MNINPQEDILHNHEKCGLKISGHEMRQLPTNHPYIDLPKSVLKGHAESGKSTLVADAVRYRQMHRSVSHLFFVVSILGFLGTDLTT